MPPKNFLSEAASYTHLGLTFAMSILLGFFGGYWLDGKIGSSPLFTLVGAFLGATGGFIFLIHTLTHAQKEKEDLKKEDGEAE